ncbi:styrene monooxygenase NADH-dependent flavin reductase subunit StyB [Bordetella genomosp. 12]|uniref:Flavin reductase like domain-containing protein n=1 Tax=Bordetella genomosp. 12 TaxID=463035 RepID=A0A261VLJ8_9BORD|nr:flavin reductase family protein [Bordetella genomosp. 12]OZI74621.1 hypothetical protein CAL22_09190 [Bordetella genomosp. 12]
MTNTELGPEALSIDERTQFRQAVSQFATGIAVVSVQAENTAEVHGMTINSFTSVSLDPPTVLISLKSGRTHGLIRNHLRFGVSVLHDEQVGLSALFSGKAPADSRPEFVVPNHSPVLRSALAWFECEVQQQVDIHDHTLFIARVTASGCVQGAPLLFFSSRYHRRQSWS